MNDLISRQAVLDILNEQERLASERVRDTPTSLGNGLHTWVNPAYTRYSTQLSERSQFKTMIQTMPPVTPQPKIDTWSIKDVADTLAKHGLIEEQEPILDKIRTEITKALSAETVSDNKQQISDVGIGLEMALSIIDKYTAGKRGIRGKNDR